MTLDDHTRNLLEAAAEVTRLIAKAAIERPEYHADRGEYEAAAAMGDDLLDLTAAMPALDRAAKTLAVYVTSVLNSREGVG